MVLWWRVPSFRPLSRSSLGASLANMALFRVLRAFLGGFYGACVGLCWLRALRGLCGFCARVELGGFMACGVFPLIYLFICLSFYLFTCFLSFILSALFWLSFGCPLVLSCLFLWSLLLFLFPLRTIRKKKGRKVFSLRPLFTPFSIPH